MIGTLETATTGVWMRDSSAHMRANARQTTGKSAAATPGSESSYNVISWEEALAGKQSGIVVPQDADELQQMQAWFMDYLARNPAPDYAELPKLSDVMTSEKWQTLAEKYDPSSMTQEQYDAFLDELCEMGALHPEDLTDLGHSRYQFGFVKLTAESCRSYLANGADLPPVSYVPKFKDGARRINLLYWAQEEKAWQYYDADKGTWLQSHKAQAFQQIYDILQGMRAYGAA